MTTSKTYWKDIRQSFSSSKGRVASIVSLMALGSFALVGLKVTAPDIRTTGANFLADHNTADLFVISDYGLNDSDKEILKQLDGKATVEYGYFTDTTINKTDTSIRIFSNSKTLSTYDLVSGKLPTKASEIALSDAYSTDYAIGDNITLNEKANTRKGDVLTEHTFTITGFVNSSELLSRISLGQSTAGTGDLKGYAVVPESTFDSEVYMIARIGYDNLEGLNPFKQKYLDTVYKDKTEVQDLFSLQPEEKLKELTSQYQEKIDEGNQKLTDAKTKLQDASQQISDGETKIKDGETQLTEGKQKIADSESQLSSAQSQLVQGEQTLNDSYNQLQSAQAQLTDGWNQLASSKSTLDEAATQIADAEATLATKKAELDAAQTKLTAGQQQLDASAETLASAKSLLDEKATELADAKAQLDQANQTIQTGFSELEAAKTALSAQMAALQAAGIDPSTVAEVTAAQAMIAQKEAALTEAQTTYETQLSAYNAGLAEWQQKSAEFEAGASQYETGKAELASKVAEYQAGLDKYESAVNTLESKKSEYNTGLATYDAAYQTLTEKQAEYDSGLAQYQSGLATYQSSLEQFQSGVSQLNEAKATLVTKEQQLADAKATLSQKKKEYEEAKAKADPELAEKEQELKDAQEKVNQLSLPTYQVYTRREVPGSEGYISYENNSSIIDSVGNFFPIALYFVAALVTFTTMTRFVEEERLKAGTFKALGYKNQDIVRKFTIYGLVTSLVGTAIGTLMGHLLLPLAIYRTYAPKIVLKPIELHFYPWQTLAAIVLALLSAVLPAFIVARKELAEKPSQLLLPKPPSAGSKILLERITPIWKRLSFTHKVTARNIFRYKQRMLMTIFGVCGSTALLFTGLGVRYSVADLNNRQFTDIIKYDMIVAKNSYLTTEQEEDISKLVASDKVDSSMAIHYENVTKIAGTKNDSQKVTVIVPDGTDKEFRNYIHLVERKSQDDLALSNDGAIISEKFASLLGAKVGDTITVQNSNEEDVTIKVSGISEMYMNHFMFMSQDYYKQTFGKQAEDNAVLVNLVDGSGKSTDALASDFMALSGVKGIVQNTALKEQVKIIVQSINKVMTILIATSALLAIVILYNLTNINIAERMRELCTIKVLGFHTNEVTMYIYRETIILSLLGILAGFGSGILLHRYMIHIIPPEAVMFNPALGYSIYLIPALLVVSILAVLGYVVTQWLKKVDMLEALKSVE